MLSQPRVAASADERCIEALLCRALDVVPGLGGVFGLPDGLRYQFGQRTVQPDVVAIDVEGKYAGGIEVKIRSNFNVNVGGSQFDTYAAGAPADCRLTALVAHSASASKFRAELAADKRNQRGPVEHGHSGDASRCRDQSSGRRTAHRQRHSPACAIAGAAHLSQGSQPRRGDRRMSSKLGAAVQDHG